MKISLVLTLTLNNGQPDVTITGIADEYTTSATLIGSTAYFDRTDTLSAYTLDLSSFVPTGDTYTTGFTYDGANNVTISQNQGVSDLAVNISVMTGLTVNGTLTATTVDAASILSGGTNLLDIFSDAANDTYVTGGTVSIPATDDTNQATIALSYINGSPTHTLPFENTYMSGGTLNGTNLELTKNDGVTETIDLSSLVDTDTKITGFTYDNANTITISDDDGGIFPVTINTMTGLTVNGTLTATTVDGATILSGGTDLATIISASDTYATGYTYTPATNTFEITGNNSFAPLSSVINEVSGLTVSNLTAGRVVYAGTGGLLTDEAGFTYDDSTNTFSVPSDGTVNVGTGGLNVDGDTVIQGSLTVFGPAISAFTTDLYVEDPNITLNYNPTGSTIATSLGAGITIQDGSGIVTEDVNLDVYRLDTLTGLTATNTPDVTEYTSGVGYANRGFITQLNDIVIRSTNVATPNGVRVLTEFDILDGGQY